MSKYEMTISGKKYLVEVGDVSASPVEIVVNGQRKSVEFVDVTTIGVPAARATAPAPSPQPKPESQPTLATAPAAALPVSTDGRAVRAPMPGKILSVRVRVGDAVSEGDTLCTLEAMKMEMPISSTVTGIVRAVHVQVGASVAHDDALVTVGQAATS